VPLGTCILERPELTPYWYLLMVFRAARANFFLGGQANTSRFHISSPKKLDKIRNLASLLLRQLRIRKGEEVGQFMQKVFRYHACGFTREAGREDK
jgi:hypothetical protein